VLSKLGLFDENQKMDLTIWENFLRTFKNPKHEVNIGLVGKYVELRDAYKSINEALVHSGAVNHCKVNVRMIHSEDLNEHNVTEKLADLNGILVAPGFGERGIEGKITSIKYARENKIPFFGICLGMQCAVVEFARNVLNFTDAHSTEIKPRTTHPVIDIMEAQKKILSKGGTMRLGAYSCKIIPESLTAGLYNKELISERHRHRYEFNNKYLNDFIEKGLIAVGINPDEFLVEIIEIKDHPWFIGVQFHPEYKSTVSSPHPLFIGFVKAAMEHNKSLK